MASLIKNSSNDAIMKFLDVNSQMIVVSEGTTAYLKAMRDNSSRVKDIVARINDVYGASSVLSRRKEAVVVKDFVVESKNAMMYFPNYVRVATLLLRITFKFSNYILKKFGPSTSLEFRMEKKTDRVTISYDDVSAFHDYVLKSRILKLIKYNTFSRKRLISGSSPSYNPVVASKVLVNAAKTAKLVDMGLGADYPDIIGTLSGKKDTFTSRGLLTDLIRRLYGPGAPGYGRYVKYTAGDFLDSLIRAVVPFGREEIALTVEQADLNKKSRKLISDDAYYKNVLSNGKKPLAVKALFKTGSRRVVDGKTTFLDILLTGNDKADRTGSLPPYLEGEEHNYISQSSITSLVACHTLSTSDLQKQYSRESFVTFTDEAFRVAVTEYKNKFGKIHALASSDSKKARVAEYRTHYAKRLADNEVAATLKAKKESAKKREKAKTNGKFRRISEF